MTSPSSSSSSPRPSPPRRRPRTPRAPGEAGRPAGRIPGPAASAAPASSGPALPPPRRRPRPRRASRRKCSSLRPSRRRRRPRASRPSGRARGPSGASRTCGGRPGRSRRPSGGRRGPRRAPRRAPSKSSAGTSRRLGSAVPLLLRWKQQVQRLRNLRALPAPWRSKRGRGPSWPSAPTPVFFCFFEFLTTRSLRRSSESAFDRDQKRKEKNTRFSPCILLFSLLSPYQGLGREEPLALVRRGLEIHADISSGIPFFLLSNAQRHRFSPRRFFRGDFFLFSRYCPVCCGLALLINYKGDRELPRGCTIGAEEELVESLLRFEKKQSEEVPTFFQPSPSSTTLFVWASKTKFEKDG